MNFYVVFNNQFNRYLRDKEGRWITICICLHHFMQAGLLTYHCDSFALSEQSFF